MVKETLTIEMKADKATFCDQAARNPIAAADMLEPEIMRFDDWMVSRSMDPLGRYERQILREYLGFKLTRPAPIEDAG